MYLSKYESPKVNVNMNAAKGVAIGIVILVVIGAVVREHGKTHLKKKTSSKY